MSQSIKVGVIGGGWPGMAHARGYDESGGFQIVAVADAIPQRRQQLKANAPNARELNDAEELIKDPHVQAISLCLPTAAHANIAVAALRAGKHVICETPPALSVKQAKQIDAASRKAGKVILYAFQRRFGGAEQASRQAVAKEYAGTIVHARASWMRTRGIPKGTGWFAHKAQAGGGAMIDIGIHMLDLAWHLLGQPTPAALLASARHDFAAEGSDVEDSGFALIRFKTGQTLELAASWAINQPPQQQGTICRLYGQKAAIDVYTPTGAQLYRNFDEKGTSRPHPLPPPRVAGHASLLRHFRDCINGKTTPSVGGPEGIILMEMIEGFYKSVATGKGVTFSTG